VQVEDWGVGDLDEIFSLRSQLEPWGCGLAATTGLADLDRLGRLADRMDEVARRDPPDLDAITGLNNEFHRTVLEASGNGRLVGMVSSVVEVPLVWRTFSHYSPEAMRRSLAHHHEIVQALAAGDAEWAESVMRSHVRAAWVSLRQEHPEGPPDAAQPRIGPPARP
jgi:DNA-binding GntR family transcriptional regulator